MSQFVQSTNDLISVSCPGGMARQFRVQVQSNETPSQWKLIGAFRDRRQAGQCAAEHAESGQKTRVVACSALPTAA